MRPGHLLGLSPGGFHRIAYVIWGEPGTLPPVVCVHGLTRNGRDFDRLAAALATARLVIAPDVVGRGASSWLADAGAYGYPQYCADMAALIARLGVDEVDWVGTSMGGLIGMMLAAQPNSPIRRLVLNDVGCRIPRQALRRLAGYVGQDPEFADPAGVEAYLRQVHAPFGQLDDEAWHQLALHGHRRLPGGRCGLAYDPKIGQAFTGTIAADIDLASIWERVRCPVLLLRGAESDLLLPETARAMASKAELVEFPAIGHAPSLMVPDQIEIVRSWLTRT
ncbi:MAG TPA: alpha/beta hydrolase [Candidatus Udaeobacter sp.]|nr:alpha/beta hydrolase [Candidatus Udaeobacter sp.]